MGTRHILRIIREILFAKPSSQGTDLSPALRMLVKASPRRALVFMISDFVAEGFEGALRTASIKHDLVAVQIKDPAEESLPPAGLLTFEDPESGEQVVANTSRRSLRASYSELAAEWQASLDRTFQSRSIDKIELKTGRDYLPSLHAFFKARSKHPH